MDYVFAEVLIVRRILENPIYMTIDEIEKEFAGKWVLVTNCVYSEDNQVIGGIPVAEADSEFEGQRDGFYDEFKDPKYSPRFSNDLNYDNIPGFVNFFGNAGAAGMVGENANNYNRQ